MQELVNNLGNIKIIMTIVVLLCFLCCFPLICYWAYSRHSKAGFDEAAQLPLTDDDPPAPPADRKE